MMTTQLQEENSLTRTLPLILVIYVHNCCIAEKFKIKKHFCCLDIVLKVRQPLESEIGLLKEHGNIISFLYPALNKPLVSKMAEKKLTAFGKKINIYLLSYFTVLKAIKFLH